jgi:hypothetical protein
MPHLRQAVSEKRSERPEEMSRVCAKCNNETLDEDLCKMHFLRLVTHEPIPYEEKPEDLLAQGRTCKHCRRLYDPDYDKWAACRVRVYEWQAPRWKVE